MIREQIVEENRKEPLPLLEQLYHRHPGLTVSVCMSYAEAASVCLSRHHQPPVDFQVTNSGAQSIRQVNWNPPDDRTRRAWNSRNVATEFGASGLCLAAVEAELGLVAIMRADVPSGADYHLAPLDGYRDLEAACKLEVSGTDSGSVAGVNRRLREKIRQAKQGRSNLPVLAGVIGFLVKVVALELVDED